MVHLINKEPWGIIQHGPGPSFSGSGSFKSMFEKPHKTMMKAWLVFDLALRKMDQFTLAEVQRALPGPKE